MCDSPAQIGRESVRTRFGQRQRRGVLDFAQHEAGIDRGNARQRQQVAIEKPLIFLDVAHGDF